MRVKSQNDHSVSNVLTILGLRLIEAMKTAGKERGVLTAYSVYPTQPVLEDQANHTGFSEVRLPLSPVGGSFREDQSPGKRQ